MRRRNPYPGVSRAPDRHGRVRWRFRSKGFSTYLPGPYGSPAFIAAYEAALEGTRSRGLSKAKHGTLGWLIEIYLNSPRHKNKVNSTRRTLRKELDWLRKQAGDLPFARFGAKHIEALMARKGGPAAANRVKKNMSMLFNFAIKQELMTHNPARAADSYDENPDGFYTWTEADMQRFMAQYDTGTKERLVFLLALNTGASRQDLCRLGWQNIQDGHITYRRGKTKVGGTYPILPELAEELKQLPSGQMLFITHSGGKPYKPETLGNWFRGRCDAVGLKKCALHGIRKGQATRIVNWGGTPDEVMAYLAHKTNLEGATYTKKANRGLLTDRGLARLPGIETEQKLSNLHEKLDRKAGK